MNADAADRPEDNDVALTLLHTADWHLGRRFPAFAPEQELRLTRARLEVVGRILDLAERRNVDAVLCAGDLFDDPSPESEWWGGLLREFTARAWSRPVLLLPGNHDPLTPRSPYDAGHEFRRALPPYVYVVDADAFTLELPERNAVILATPCRSHAGQSNLAASLPPRQEGDARFRIGLLHGQTFDIKDHQTNFPIARGTADALGLDYLAIGDTHAFREVEAGARAPTIYPGAPEATNFGERDTGHVAIVFFPRDRARRPHIERVAVGTWKWREAACASLADLRNLRAEADLRRTVLRLRLDMRVPLAEYDEARRILEELRGSLAANPRVGVLLEDSDGLRLALDGPLPFAADLPPVLQATVRRLQQSGAENAELAERALHHLYKLVTQG